VGRRAAHKQLRNEKGNSAALGMKGDARFGEQICDNKTRDDGQEKGGPIVVTGRGLRGGMSVDDGECSRP